MMLDLGFLQIPLAGLTYAPSISFLQGFYHQGILKFTKTLPESIVITLSLISYGLWTYYCMFIISIIDLLVLNHSCIPEIRPFFFFFLKVLVEFFFFQKL